MVNCDDESIRSAYNAAVNYHNTLVQVRFAVASLFIAASAFLIGVIFQEKIDELSKNIISMLAVMITFIIWIIEMRTYCLLRNITNIGIKYEKHLNFRNTLGFFSLMNGIQPIGVRLPFVAIDMKNSKIKRKIFSHSFGLDCLYIFFLLFWLYIIAHNFKVL